MKVAVETDGTNYFVEKTKGNWQLLADNMTYRREIRPIGLTSGNGLRVLCAEDDERLALLVKECLQMEGDFVECVPNGAEALERLTREPNFYNLLITDHSMPGKTGLELVAELSLIPFRGSIVVHSGGLQGGVIDAYRQLGVEHVFDKPLAIRDLMKLIQELRAKKAPGANPGPVSQE